MPSLVTPVLPPGRLGESVQPELQVEAAMLRPWRLADAKSVVAAYADPEIERWHVRSMTLLEAEEWIRAGLQAWQEERAASWAIDVGGFVAGRMTLKLRPAHGVAEAAYWTVPAARGRGLASQALLEATAWGFGIGLHRIELEHSTLNSASCRVADKAGFEAEGTRRSAGLHADGWHDMHLHGRVSSAPADRS